MFIGVDDVCNDGMTVCHSIWFIYGLVTVIACFDASFSIVFVSSVLYCFT